MSHQIHTNTAVTGDHGLHWWEALGPSSGASVSPSHCKTEQRRSLTGQRPSHARTSSSLTSGIIITC